MCEAETFGVFFNHLIFTDICKSNERVKKNNLRSDV